MTLINLLNNKIINLSKFKLLSIIILICLFKNGIWYHPALWNMLEIAKDPFGNVFIDQTQKYYLYSNWLGSYIAYLLNIESKISFFLLHLIFAILFIFFTIKYIFEKSNKKFHNKSIILFFSFPVSMISFFWVGYDSLLLLLMILSILFSGSNLIVLLLSVGVGLQHFEIGIIAYGLLCFCKIHDMIFFKKRTTIKLPFNFFIFAIIGVALGKLLLLNIYGDFELVTGKISFAISALLHLSYNYFFNFYNIIWFSFGISWLIVIKYFLDFKNSRSVILSIIFILFFILPFVDDHTRVFSGCSFLIIVVYILTNNDFLNKISKKNLVYFFVLWVLTPYSYVWQGDLRQSMFQYDLAYVLDYFFGIFNNNIESSTIWPFKRFK